MGFGGSPVSEKNSSRKLSKPPRHRKSRGCWPPKRYAIWEMRPPLLAGTLIARERSQGGASDGHSLRAVQDPPSSRGGTAHHGGASPRFRSEVPGLVQKYYGYEPDSGAFCGCYIFDSEESRQAFRQSELARTIPAAYQFAAAAEEVRVEAYEVLFPLYEMPQLAGQGQHTH